MDEPNEKSPDVTRRALLGGLGLALAPWSLSRLLACAPSVGAAQPVSAGPASAAIPSANVPWATGGTASMTAAASYPDPFARGLGAACDLTCEATLGPCYAETLERQDLSEGMQGLPLRMEFLVVDPECAPIVGAKVDVWHCAPDGLYSGEDASDFCTSGDQVARANRWFRGTQTTDARGRVRFDSCFPGWYSSRTVHVHFAVVIDGTEQVVSQLVFDDALDDEILSGQKLYNARGARDTRNTDDNVVGGERDLSKVTFETARMRDGAMLAWKTLVVRRGGGGEACQIQGAAGGPGGPGGGPPPGGGASGGPSGPGGPPPGGASGGPGGPPPGGPGSSKRPGTPR